MNGAVRSTRRAFPERARAMLGPSTLASQSHAVASELRLSPMSSHRFSTVKLRACVPCGPNGRVVGGGFEA